MTALQLFLESYTLFVSLTVIDFRPEHSLKAPAPIEATFGGITNDFRKLK